MGAFPSTSVQKQSCNLITLSWKNGCCTRLKLTDSAHRHHARNLVKFQPIINNLWNAGMRLTSSFDTNQSRRIMSPWSPNPIRRNDMARIDWGNGFPIEIFALRNRLTATAFWIATTASRGKQCNYTWTHRNDGQSCHFRHENFEKFEMFSTPTGSWIRSRRRRDRIQLPVGVENISNFSKFSCRKWHDCPPFRWVQVMCRNKVMGIRNAFECNRYFHVEATWNICKRTFRQRCVRTNFSCRWMDSVHLQFSFIAIVTFLWHFGKVGGMAKLTFYQFAKLECGQLHPRMHLVASICTRIRATPVKCAKCMTRKAVHIAATTWNSRIFRKGFRMEF